MPTSPCVVRHLSVSQTTQEEEEEGADLRVQVLHLEVRRDTEAHEDVPRRDDEVCDDEEDRPIGHTYIVGIRSYLPAALDSRHLDE